jgi:hypothetical protein
MKVTETTIEEMNHIPPIVYKYRTWNNKFHREIITDQIVFMAMPTSFDDPLDCKLQKRYDLITDEEIFTKYLQMSIDSPKHKYWTPQQHIDFANDGLANGPMRDKEYIEKAQQEDFNQFNDRFGVLSLTANPVNRKMWEEYSENHKGFCVGFDTKIMFKYLGGGGEVVYYDELPIINAFDSFEVEHFKQVFSKEKKWSYEEEYRTHKFYKKPATLDDRRITLPKECFREIIFGANQPENQREEIIQICSEQELNVKFFVESKNNGEIKTIEIPSR